jgi:hypothetical protein
MEIRFNPHPQENHSKEGPWKIADETCCLCDRRASFEIYRIKVGKYMFLCSNHDNYVGVENLIAQGIPHKQAREINREVKGSDGTEDK